MSEKRCEESGGTRRGEKSGARRGKAEPKGEVTTWFTGEELDSQAARKQAAMKTDSSNARGSQKTHAHTVRRNNTQTHTARATDPDAHTHTHTRTHGHTRTHAHDSETAVNQGTHLA